jgi:hypothetical protein
MRQVFQDKVVSVPKSGSKHCHVLGTEYSVWRISMAFRQAPSSDAYCIYYKAWTRLPLASQQSPEEPHLGKVTWCNPRVSILTIAQLWLFACGRKAQPQIYRVLIILFRVMFKSSVKVSVIQ